MALTMKCKQIIKCFALCVVWSDTAAHGQLLVISVSFAVISHTPKVPVTRCLPNSSKPDSPKLGLGFRVRLRV